MSNKADTEKTRNGDGTARPLELSRLANFEDSDPGEPEFALPHRFTRQQPARASEAPARQTAPEPPATEAPAVVDLTGAPTEPVVARAPAPIVAPTPDAPPAPVRRRRGRPAKDQPQQAGSEVLSDQERVRASNVHVPAPLVAKLRAYTQQTGMSTGEAIIVAIEETYEVLQERISPPRTSGKLFATRVAKPTRATPGSLTQLNFRFSAADFAVLDNLVDTLEASSRNHLITVALTEFLDGQAAQQLQE